MEEEEDDGGEGPQMGMGTSDVEARCKGGGEGLKMGQ